MTHAKWNEVEQYLCEKLVPQDLILEATLQSIRDTGMPEISVSPTEGKFLQILVQMMHARRVLEVGTLAGYSTIWMARGLADGGKIVTLEAFETHADVARKNFETAGISELVDLRVGKALDTLPELEGPFDFVFIDADKENNSAYFDWAVKLSRPGAVIVVDNVIRDGKVADAATTNPMVLGVRDMFQMLSADHRATTTAIQTVGSKGYDGFSISIVR